MSDPIDIFSEKAPPPDAPRGKWDFVKKPWFIIAVGIFLAFVVFVFSLNQVIGTLLHSRPEVSVPNLEGKGLVDALQTASALDLSLQHESTDYDESLPAGTVIRQLPASGMKVRAGRSIRVVVSKGGQASFVPDIAGKRLAEAQSVLAAGGIQLGAVAEAYSVDLSKGMVIDQQPSSGTVVSRGAMVDITVSKGPPPSGLPIAPDLGGKTADEVNRWSRESKIEVTIREDKSAGGIPGTVVKQVPAPGQPILEEQALIVTIVPLSGGTASRLTLEVPSDVDTASVRVVARDSRGESEVYEGRHAGGSKVDVPVAVNTTTRFRIYINDILQEERVVEP
jgi:eukaryotic-like serine/threonine-protein kinase